MNACCTGCSVPFDEMPSIVSTARPSQATARVMHEYTGRPSTSTVQAPQSPSLQTFFVPVRPRESRRVSRSERSGPTRTDTFRPFTSSATSMASGPRNRGMRSIVSSGRAGRPSAEGPAPPAALWAMGRSAAGPAPVPRSAAAPSGAIRPPFSRADARSSVRGVRRWAERGRRTEAGLLRDAGADEHGAPDDQSEKDDHGHREGSATVMRSPERASLLDRCGTVCSGTTPVGRSLHMAIEKIGVVGFGQMGSGIAQVCAMAGFDVLAREIDQKFIDNGLERVDASLARVVKAGRMSEADAKAARGRIRGTTALADFGDRDLVIEAVIEVMDAKKEVWTELDRVCGPNTLFASNTSSLTIIEMAAATKRPDRFAGMHFFNPPVVMQLVEIVRALTTSDATVEALRAFVTKLGKEPVVCKDTPGFIVNRLMVPIMLEAVRALEAGVATVEDIDKAVKLGLRHPMGPFELIDYTGIDINYHVANVFFDELKDP